MVSLLRAKIERTVTNDGVMELEDYVRVGDDYLLYPSNTVVHKHGNTDHPGKVFTRTMIMAINPRENFEFGMLPLECFEAHDKWIPLGAVEALDIYLRIGAKTS